MKRIDAIPRGFKPVMTDGDAFLYWSPNSPKDAIIYNQGSIGMVNLDAALNHGQWEELSGDEELPVVVSTRTRKGSDVK